MESIVLASGSPRRQDFFKLLGIPFSCIPPMIDETPLPGLSPRKVAEDLAVRKALAAAKKSGNGEWIFGADTIVVLDGELFGKPPNRETAREMLCRLSGKQHEVITAIALHNRHNNQTDCRSVSCEVTFAALEKDDIEWYLNSGEWEGAAGAYRLQSLGACLIKKITGSPSAVAGLPLHDFYVMLKNNGYFQK